MEYVSLGANLLTGIGGAVTIEIWATPHDLQYYSRIFEFGVSTSERLVMTWTVNVSVDEDMVLWQDQDQQTRYNTNAPYTIDEAFHVVMILAPGGGTGGTLRIGWYSAPAAAATMDTLAQFNDADGFLGKSHYPDDPVATASYDEVRIWSGALSEAAIELLHALGPDGYTP